jgi:hypothetical protein
MGGAAEGKDRQVGVGCLAVLLVVIRHCVVEVKRGVLKAAENPSCRATKNKN